MERPPGERRGGCGRSRQHLVVDDAFEEKLDTMLGHPKVDPHGRPIPNRNATWPKLGDAPLLSIPPGTTGVVSRILTDESDAIGYLKGLGVEPGVRFGLEGMAPFEGPVSLRVGGQTLHLGRRLAQAIHVGEDANDTASTRPAARKPSDRG